MDNETIKFLVCLICGAAIFVGIAGLFFLLSVMMSPFNVIGSMSRDDEGDEHG